MGIYSLIYTLNSFGALFKRALRSRYFISEEPIKYTKATTKISTKIKVIISIPSLVKVSFSELLKANFRPKNMAE